MPFLKKQESEYDRKIEKLNEEVYSAINQLDLMDVTSEDYATGVKNLKCLQEAVQLERKDKLEERNSKVPAWAVNVGTTIFGALVALGFGYKVLKIDQEGGAISPNSISVFDKVIRKF